MLPRYAVYGRSRPIPLQFLILDAGRSIMDAGATELPPRNDSNRPMQLAYGY